MTNRHRFVVSLLIPPIGLVAAVPIGGQEAPKVDYLTDVQPILETYCYECHGEDRARREADLRLDIKERAFADLGGFPNIAPGDPADSELYIRVSSEIAEMRMPPYEAGAELSEEQVETIRLWIEQGAEWPESEDAEDEEKASGG